ncbi:Protein of unknown function [Gryllus bimaculatus]|nr:Protein of unknown function [Gryllus bimaculatus]
MVTQHYGNANETIEKDCIFSPLARRESTAAQHLLHKGPASSWRQFSSSYVEFGSSYVECLTSFRGSAFFFVLTPEDLFNYLDFISSLFFYGF